LISPKDNRKKYIGDVDNNTSEGGEEEGAEGFLDEGV
jgi:hypothetical protein